MSRRRRQYVGASSSLADQVSQEITYSEFDPLLPFTLQDICLLEVINDLDSYPVDLLASMPYWFRKKLLSNLPLLDLNSLDSSKVAKDVNVDSIWAERYKSLLASRQPRYGWCGTAAMHDMLTNVSFHMNCASTILRVPRATRIGQALENVRKSVAVKKSVNSKAKCLFEITASILLNESSFDNGQNEKSVLISIDGEQLYKNLLLQPSRPRRSLEQIYTVLRKQRTMLTLVEVGIDSRRQSARPRLSNVSKKNNVVWIPHRLMHHYLYSDNTSTVLSILANECSVRPPSANVCLDELSHEVLAHIHAERYAQENGLVPTPVRVKCSLSVHQVLSKVKILRFKSRNYSNVGAMIAIIEGLKAKKNECLLQHLFCESPNLYPDLVKPLTGLFHLPNFNEMTLNLTSLYHVNFVRLIHGFMTSPCTHRQILTIVSKPMVQAAFCYLKAGILPYSLEKEDLATLDIDMSAVPQCAIEHKIVRFLEPQVQTTQSVVLAKELCNLEILPILLQFSTIRLNEIYIGSSKALHLCTLHPDLHVMKIEIDLENNCLVRTIREDLTNIFKVPYLQEITISGTWGSSIRAKSGLVQGLSSRAQACAPLKKITLRDTSQSYSDIEYQELWNVIFSLPDIDKLEIVLSKQMLDASNQSESECIMMFKSWSKSGKEHRLKYVSIAGLGISETDRRHLLIFTQMHSFVATH